MLAYSRQKIFLPLVQISLTERCTLRCKKCAHACNLVPRDAEDLQLKEACQSADMLFSFVDYVQDFVLIGGEPFLYKDLGKVIIYIGEKYRDRIHSFSITTNGTIMPSDNLLNLCKRYNILVRISNYTKALPRLERQYEKMTGALKRNGIKFLLGNKDIDWMDYGFEYVNRKGTPEQLAAVFDACATPCHEVRGDKFYFCVMARSVSENMQRNVGEDDYLDLSELKPGVNNKIFFEYIMGYSEKGYLDMCNYCHGAEVSQYPIPIAEHME